MANEEIMEDLNPVTTVYETTDTTLTKKETHKDPVTKSSTWNIAREQAAIDKIKRVIAQWDAKMKVHADIIAKHAEEHNKPK